MMRDDETMQRGRGRRTGAAIFLSFAAAACAAPTVEAPAEIAWVFPTENLVWRQAELQLVLLAPETEPVAGTADGTQRRLDIELNGRSITARCLPGFQFPRAVDAALTEEGRGADAASGQRVMAVLTASELQEGENRLEAIFTGAAGREQRAVRRFEFAPAGRPVHLRIVRDTAHGPDTHAGARIVIEALDGAPEVHLSTLDPPRLPYGSNLLPRSWLLARDGVASGLLPEGRYRATVTGGPLDSVSSWVTPPAGPVLHTFHLHREIDLPGTATVDFHVHGEASRDAWIPLERRVRSFLAAGVDWIVASDHGTITDYGDLIAHLPGAAGRLRAISGVEAGMGRASRQTPLWGHWNVWPLTPDPGTPGNGALRWTTAGGPAHGQLPVEVAGLFDAYRARARDLARRRLSGKPLVDPVVIQLNHPRGILFPRDSAPKRLHDWFNQVDFQPTVPIPPAGTHGGPNAGLLDATPAGTTALDFDALEIWNRNSRQLYVETRNDWFSLLDQGYVRTATANTDTHTLGELAGYPENIVLLADGEPAGPSASVGSIAAAVRAGRVIGTDGPVPLLTVTAGSRTGRIGDLVPAPEGRVQVSVTVHAATWVPIGSIRIWINGHVAATGPPPGPDAVRPVSLSANVALAKDAWIIAEVGDPEALPETAPLPGIYGRLVPRGLALGFTNPVFVDVDANGRFDAPGLPGRTGPLPPAGSPGED
ncbi:MAG: hypothetical protein ACE5IK_10640 [Acidobacteriota bacterium]